VEKGLIVYSDLSVRYRDHLFVPESCREERRKGFLGRYRVPVTIISDKDPRFTARFPSGAKYLRTLKQLKEVLGARVACMLDRLYSTSSTHSTIKIIKTGLVHSSHRPNNTVLCNFVVHPCVICTGTDQSLCHTLLLVICIKQFLFFIFLICLQDIYERLNEVDTQLSSLEWQVEAMKQNVDWLTNEKLAADEANSDKTMDEESQSDNTDNSSEDCQTFGYVVRQLSSIFSFPFMKETTCTYFYEGPTTKDKEATELFHDGVIQSGQDSAVTEIGAHPRHKNQMKPHQVEGFNFLLSNLVTENRGGCILAHAPSSRKTLMTITFIQSFLAKYPHARPLM
ncbi:Protein CHROMATIN REMODELING 35, partial [Camellia lanceoleosa]